MTNTATIRLPRTGSTTQSHAVGESFAGRLERILDRVAAHVAATFGDRRVR